MKDTFEINAQRRDQAGTRASRRLRRTNTVPAVLYGAGDPVSIMVDAHELSNHLKVEAFYSHLLILNLDEKKESVILRGLQRHPSEDRILHLDFFRVSENQAIRVQVPIHYLNEENCAGVKEQGGVISHIHTNVEVSCLPKDLPEFLTIDVLELRLGESLHFSDMKLPTGVEIVALSHGEGTDEPIVSVHTPRVSAVEEAAEAAEASAEEEATAEDKEKEAKDEGEDKK